LRALFVNFSDTGPSHFILLDSVHRLSSQLSVCRKRQQRDPAQHLRELHLRQVSFRPHQPIVPRMLYQTPTRLHQPLLQAGQKPVIYRSSSVLWKRLAGRSLLQTTLSIGHISNQVDSVKGAFLLFFLCAGTQASENRNRLPCLNDAPRIEIVLPDRKDVLAAGAGETGIVCLASAAGNAIFAATGVRLRRMPMAPRDAAGQAETSLRS
jgi:hypothetical protein